MFNPNWIPLVVALNVSYCGGPGNGGDTGTEASDGFFSCADYRLMVRVETEVMGYCADDLECGQVLSGTGIGCPTDDLIANNSYNEDWFFDLVDEAEAAGCSIEIGTSGECDPYAVPVCQNGQCDWD